MKKFLPWLGGFLIGVTILLMLSHRYVVVPGNLHYAGRDHACFLKIDNLTGRTWVLTEDSTIDMFWLEK